MPRNINVEIATPQYILTTDGILQESNLGYSSLTSVRGKRQLVFTFESPDVNDLSPVVVFNFSGVIEGWTMFLEERTGAVTIDILGSSSSVPTSSICGGNLPNSNSVFASGNVTDWTTSVSGNSCLRAKVISGSAQSITLTLQIKEV
jgi:hypothetical protein